MQKGARLCAGTVPCTGKMKAFLKKLNEKHPLLMEIVRFLIIGGAATVLDMLVMGAVVYAFDPSLYPHFYNVWYGGGEPSTLATVVGTGAGFVAGLIFNYIFSILFVFSEKGKSKSALGFTLFTLLSAVGLAIHLLGMWLGYDVLGINEWIVKIVLTVIVLIYNYVSKRLLLFRKGKAAAQAAEEEAEGAQPAEEEAAQTQPAAQSAAVQAAVQTGEEEMENTKMRKKLSIVVPCYNEEECLPLFYQTVSKMTEALPVLAEFVFVDDGSKDGTLAALRALACGDARVRYLSFSRNFGKEAALFAGLRAAEGDLVCVMDADLQDPPELLAQMFYGIEEEGYDCVGCRRTDRKNEPKVRSAFSRLFYRLINRMADTEIVDGARDFRMMTRRMTDAILALPERDRFSKELFSWVGFKTKWLEYENRERAAGKTKWNFKKLTRYAVGGIEGASTSLLKVNLWMAALFLLACFGFVVADIVLAALGEPVSELFILLPVLFFVAFALLLGLFVVSEYIKKIFVQVRARPVYIVRESEKDLPAAARMPNEEKKE